ncbi:hypothetical protein Tco_0607181 [Tanacetum coccineum]
MVMISNGAKGKRREGVGAGGAQPLPNNDKTTLHLIKIPSSVSGDDVFGKMAKDLALKVDEHSLGRSSSTSDMIDFQECVNDVNVVDVRKMGFHFTWTKSLHNPNSHVSKKLDRVMGNDQFIDSFKEAYVLLEEVLSCIFSVMNSIQGFDMITVNFFTPSIRDHILNTLDVVPCNIVLGERCSVLLFSAKAYQRTLNLTKPKLYFEGIKDRIPYIMSGAEKGLVYLNQHNCRSLMKLIEFHKFCDGTLMKIQENLIDMVKKNELGRGNKKLKGRDWNDKDIKRSTEMLD